MENVAHVITDGVSSYVDDSALLEAKYRHIFWSSCAEHCINILKDIGDLHVYNAIIKKARRIKVFIYRHSLVLSLMRSFTRKNS